jgi:uncharacterized protein YeaO (DUF488 family)
MIKIKRIYEPPSPDDGYRVLVDRLWPRGVKREAAGIDAWLKALAPSTELWRWFDTGGASWPEFESRYRAELAESSAAADLADLRSRGEKGAVTLLYAKRDERRNNAVVLRDVLLGHAGAPGQ